MYRNNSSTYFPSLYLLNFHFIRFEWNYSCTLFGLEIEGGEERDNQEEKKLEKERRERERKGGQRERRKERKDWKEKREKTGGDKNSSDR